MKKRLMIFVILFIFIFCSSVVFAEEMDYNNTNLINQQTDDSIVCEREYYFDSEAIVEEEVYYEL